LLAPVTVAPHVEVKVMIYNARVLSAGVMVSWQAAAFCKNYFSDSTQNNQN